MEFACLQHLDMIKLRLGFGESDRISELLQKQYCKIKAQKFTWIISGWIFFFYLRRSSSQDQFFVATIQICNELVFLCLQNHFVSVSIICEATRFAIIEFKFNIKQDCSLVLGCSPDMTIRKVREKHNHSQHYSCQYSMYL